jgi:hypothetical protein
MPEMKVVKELKVARVATKKRADMGRKVMCTLKKNPISALDHECSPKEKRNAHR